jgi:hypothetical protein
MRTTCSAERAERVAFRRCGMSAADRHAAVEHHRRERRTQLAETRAEAPAVERLGMSGGRRPRRRAGRVVVGPAGHHRVTHVRVPLEEVEHLGRVSR